METIVAAIACFLPSFEDTCSVLTEEVSTQDTGVGVEEAVGLTSIGLGSNTPLAQTRGAEESDDA